MITKLFAAAGLGIAIITIFTAFKSPSAFRLRQEEQPDFRPRRGTDLSGRYTKGEWVSAPSRREYSNFRGGGPSSGK